MSVLGYLAKLKRSLGLTFGEHFLHDFFHKNVPYLILYQWPKFQCHTLFLSQDIKQNMLLSSYLDKWWHHKLKIFLGSPSKAMAEGRKDRKTKIQKFEYLKNGKSFLDEIKNIVFEGLSLWWKIADTSYKDESLNAKLIEKKDTIWTHFMQLDSFYSPWRVQLYELCSCSIFFLNEFCVQGATFRKQFH